MGGGVLPAPLLSARSPAPPRSRRSRHPANTPPRTAPHPRAVLATFIRCRDLTCRFPGCDAPAEVCDVDHTIAYPTGPTQASNLKCLCRKHHLLKIFGGWQDCQWPDGTVVWTSPHAQTYTTHPGSRILFPTLCEPTAPITHVNTPSTSAGRALAMPRRKTTRTHNRTQAINDERAHNQILIQAEAEARARQQREDPENACDETPDPSGARPAGDHDPPPF